MHTDKGPGTGGLGTGDYTPIFWLRSVFFTSCCALSGFFWARFAVWTGLAGEIEKWTSKATWASFQRSGGRVFLPRVRVAWVATGTSRTNWRWAFVFNQAEAAREASPAVTAQWQIRCLFPQSRPLWSSRTARPPGSGPSQPRVWRRRHSGPRSYAARSPSRHRLAPMAVSIRTRYRNRESRSMNPGKPNQTQRSRYSGLCHRVRRSYPIPRLRQEPLHHH